jgi:hypothetical protein
LHTSASHRVPVILFNGIVTDVDCQFRPLHNLPVRRPTGELVE